MSKDLMPAVPAEVRERATTGFSRRSRDDAFRAEVERYAAWIQGLLDDTPAIIDSPMIRERRIEAARAVLDLLWAVIARRNLLDDEPQPVPGLIAHKFPPELRRLGRG